MKVRGETGVAEEMDKGDKSENSNFGYIKACVS